MKTISYYTRRIVTIDKLLDTEENILIKIIKETLYS